MQLLDVSIFFFFYYSYANKVLNGQFVRPVKCSVVSGAHTP